MEIYWKNEKTKELFKSEKKLQKKGLDKKERRNLFTAMNFLQECTSINKMPSRYNCHPLKSTNPPLYGLDLPSVGGGRGKNRIILIPIGDFDKAHIETITKVKIMGIENYHD